MNQSGPLLLRLLLSGEGDLKIFVKQELTGEKEVENTREMRQTLWGAGNWIGKQNLGRGTDLYLKMKGKNEVWLSIEIRKCSCSTVRKEQVRGLESKRLRVC